MTYKCNNGACFIKEIMLYPDKDESINATEKEVESVFKEGIWNIVPQTEMIKHYEEQRNDRKTIDI